MLQTLKKDKRTEIAGSQASLRMRPRGVFDFALSAHIFRHGAPDIESFASGVFRRIVRLASRPVLLSITGTGQVENPGLTLRTLSGRALTLKDARELRGKVRHIFSLDADLSRFYLESRHDRVLSPAVKRLYGLRPVKTETAYEALVSAIIEQQISLVAARSMQGKMIRSYGDRLIAAGETFYAFPVPEQLAELTVAKLRKVAGLSNRKAEYVIDVSRLIADGRLDLESLASRPSEEIVGTMTSLRGIGRWTAEMMLIRGMHKTDVLPAGDLGLRRLISHYYNQDAMLSADEVRALTESWGEWKGLAVYYLLVDWLLQSGRIS